MEMEEVQDWGEGSYLFATYVLVFGKENMLKVLFLLFLCAPTALL